MEFLPNTEPERQYWFMDRLKSMIAEESIRAGRDLTYYIQTFGCQMNAKDSEKLAGVLENIGYREAGSENADFVIYNTCTVRENANTRVYGRIGYLGTLKAKNPFMKIALCGCMMQEPHEVEKIRKSYRFVDIVFGTHNIFKLAELIYEKMNSDKKQLIDVWDSSAEIVEDLPSARKFDFTYGCNNFCTYCIVPYVRGREKSRKPEDIVKEVQSLADQGVVEIMLLGQNVNSYGKGLENKCSFAELLQKVCKVEGIKRVRFMTPHPKDFSDDVIEVMKKEPKICAHVHLPVQSGSSRILKKMNRNYTKEKYLTLVEKIKSNLPDVSLTTDIIVGFPGETEEDFLETVDVVKKCGYDSAFTFIYSKRTGTPAAKFPDEVPEDVVKDRFERLLTVCKAESEKAAAKLTGKTVEVLVEGRDEGNNGMLTGRLSNNLLVHFEGCDKLIGKLVNVKLDECKGFYYLGSVSE
ncbi:MAG: tRNA (N6-isopentenyl adenosine(37)-C2)-methylthiotransferase MiaB [Lachnospiraceae bacterium]|nr:tRNA (N6-isopentenyl adenosine(37)-C2)-methylthiotransferase MiaB [Lachnospiraceae bacterium]